MVLQCLFKRTIQNTFINYSVSEIRHSEVNRLSRNELWCNGHDVHVHEIRKESGADLMEIFNSIENWTRYDFQMNARMGLDRIAQIRWFSTVDLIHPDDEIPILLPMGCIRVAERGPTTLYDQALRERLSMQVRKFTTVPVSNNVRLLQQDQRIQATFGEFSIDHGNIVVSLTTN